MIRHGGVTFLVVVAAAAGCGASRPANRGANELSLSRAAAVGEFSDNPLLASVPADTAYAFASFKPVSPDFVHAIRTAFSGMWHREFQRDLQNDEEGAERARAFEQWLAGLDARRLDELGFSSRARFVLYGLQGYPVLRIELSNGDRVVELVERTAKDWRVKLPPHIDHVGRRYWITDISDAGMLIAVGRTEAVIAVAPHDVIERNLGALVGGQRPAKSLTTAQFRELAARDGFTGQALGFLDLPRASAMFAEAAGVKPECRAAIVDVARSLPRLVIGFDDLTAHRMAMGLVLELAPDLLADVRGLAIPLAGYTRMIDRNPAMAVAVAADVERGRALAARGLVALRHVGERCKNPKFVGMTSFLAVAVARPLPAMLAGTDLDRRLRPDPDRPSRGAAQADRRGDAGVRAAAGRRGAGPAADARVPRSRRGERQRDRRRARPQQRDRGGRAAQGPPGAGAAGVPVVRLPAARRAGAAERAWQGPRGHARRRSVVRAVRVPAGRR
ncbi:MAG: hypothetical protein E6J91_17480 [Deltaproteobacteria bacterium]|nr:MAG: hypothetical protein E6J91_17480 [Deltaproteobacteria bacterium]